MKTNKTDAWLYTSHNEPRGYIQPHALEDLWFHTGTNCNLCCPVCLEGSKPGDDRIEFLTLVDTRRFINEALELGVKQFSFTGGEPFVNPEFIDILNAALEHRSCLVLTNGTDPLKNSMADILKFYDKSNPVKFRISLDYPDPAKHDELRGEGNFSKALDTLGRLHEAGFSVSVARRVQSEEDSVAMDKAYAPFFNVAGIPEDTTIIKFPEFHHPESFVNVPEITETCMSRYLNEKQREAFMCNFSKMIVRKNGQCGVYACTLVDDADNYKLGTTLKEAIKERVMLRHHRCYSCFTSGASCSESN